MKFIYTLTLIVTVIFIIILSFIKIYDRLTRKYVDRYTLTLYFGRKGCGKSTTLQKLALQHIKKGWHVFADKGSSNLSGVTFIDGKKVYKYKYPPNSLILLDESVIKFNNRDWKNFEKEAMDFFVEQRKHQVKIIMFANTFGVDSKIRDMNDYLVLCRKWFRVFMVGRVYYKIPIIISSEQSNREACECDDYKKIPWYFGGIKITYIPRYIKHFNTNAKLSEEQKEIEKGDGTASTASGSGTPTDNNHV